MPTVTITLKLCATKRERRGVRKPYDTEQLRDQNVKQQFHIEIRNRYVIVANNADDWLQLKKVYCEIADTGISA